MSRAKATVNLFKKILGRMDEQKSLDKATEEVTQRAHDVPVQDVVPPKIDDMPGETPGPEVLRPEDPTPPPPPETPGPIDVGETYTPEEAAGVVEGMRQPVDDPYTNLNQARIQSTEDVIGLADSLMRAQRERGEGMGPRKTFEGIEEASKDVTWENIHAKWRAGEDLNTEELRRAREFEVSLLAGIQTRTDELLEMSENGTLSSELEYQFRVDLTKMAAISQMVANQKRRVAQSLASLRDTVTENQAIRNLQREHFLDTVGREQSFETILKKINAQASAEDVGKILNPTKMQRLYGVMGNTWYNAVLSKFAVGKAALGGIGINKVLYPVETLLASGVSALRRTYPDGMSDGLNQRVRAGEALIEMSGFFQGFADALAPMLKQLDDPDYNLGPTKFNRGRPKDTLYGHYGGKPEGGNRNGGEIARDIGLQMVDAITQNGSRRAMQLSDYATRSMTFQQKTKAMAYRVAANEGLEGDQLIERMNEIMRTMPDEVFDKALDDAAVATMTQNLWKTSRKVEDFISGVPMLRFFSPFTRTMLAMFQAGVERMPGSHKMSDAVREAWDKGGASRDMVLAKQTMGMTLLGMGAWMASEGRFSSGMSLDKDEQYSRMKSGWRPNSVLINEKWYSPQMFTPAYEFLSVGAHLYEISHYMNEGVLPTDPRHKDWGEVISDTSMGLVWGFVDMNLNKSVGSGLLEFLKALENPGRFGKQKVIDTAAPLGQTALAHVRRGTGPIPGGDPMRRRMPEGSFYQELIDKVTDNLPGLSDDLPPAVGFFGEVKPEYSLLDGFSMSPVHDQAKIFQELYLNGINARMPTNKLTTPFGVVINLDTDITPEMLKDDVDLPQWDDQDRAEYGKRGFLYFRYSRIRGQMYQQVLSEIIEDPNYKEDNAGVPTNSDLNLTNGELLQRGVDLANEASKVMFLEELDYMMKKPTGEYITERLEEVGPKTMPFEDLGLERKAAETEQPQYEVKF